MKEPTFTIIIPHYGIPELLRRCLDSIPVGDDFQVIVVDDRSPDFDTYRDRYPDLFREGVTWLQTPHNGGAGLARNVGLDHATGKWLLFADADDLFTEDMEELLDAYKNAEDDIIYFRRRSVLSAHLEETSNRDSWMDGLFERALSSGDYREIRFNHCVPWSKMIRRSLVEENRIRFDELPFSNDVMFSLTAGSKARSVAVIDRELYVSTIRTGSLTDSFARKSGELRVRADVAIRAQKLMRAYGCPHALPHLSLSFFLSKMIHRDRVLFMEYFNRIPEVYDSYWQPLKEMAGKEEGVLRKGLLYAFSLYAYLFGKRFRKDSGANTRKASEISSEVE